LTPCIEAARVGRAHHLLHQRDRLGRGVGADQRGDARAEPVAARGNLCRARRQDFLLVGLGQAARADPGPGHRQLDDAAGIMNREALRDPRAEGIADQPHAIERERGEEIGERVGVVLAAGLVGHEPVPTA